MGVASLPQSVNYPQGHVEGQVETALETRRETDWLSVTVGGTLLAGSLLLLSGKRKAGLVVTAAGTALALLEEQDAVRTWWDALPNYLSQAQRLLDEAQTTLDSLAEKRERLRAMFRV